ncbi:hypothetical protein SEA_EMOTION_67 [Arthrobacter phage Emotion]|uniref:Uncharacterized protein n=1 Tax=Arthrobacter phage Emotion TaxID=3038361 RepID=A0AA49IKY7_9CAUD|nr:hypothetical protein SEA_EMOTION_67 [Arthrobacter phage Emotion]
MATYKEHLDAVIRYMRRASVTNHPYVELADSEVLGQTYAAMMHAIAAHLEAADGHLDVSVCFVSGLLQGASNAVPHDHLDEDDEDEESTAAPEPSEAPTAAAYVPDVAQGEILPQADQEAILAAFSASLDKLPTFGEEPKERPRFYLASGVKPEDGAPLVLVVDRETGIAYPFHDPMFAERAQTMLAKGDDVLLSRLTGNEASHYGHTAQR